MDCDDMFSAGHLSFDSNLDSLIDADFEPDLEHPFPSHYQMSAHVNEGADMIVHEGVGVVETADDSKPDTEALKETITDASGEEKRRDVLHSEHSNAGIAFGDADVNGKDTHINNIEPVVEKKINTIDNLKLMELKEKRRKRLAEKSKNELKMNESAECKGNSDISVGLLVKAKKRKHNESFETSNDITKRIKDKDKPTGKTMEKFISNGLESNVNIKDEVETDLEERANISSSIPETKETSSMPCIPKDAKQETDSSVKHELVVEKQVSETVISNEHKADIDERRETDIEVKPEKDINKQQETVIQKKHETDSDEQPDRDIDNNNAETKSGDGFISEGEIFSEGEIVSEAGIESEADVISEGGVNSSEGEFMTDLDDELILDEVNDETDASEIQETTLVDTDQTTLTDNGLDKENEDGDFDPTVVDDSADNEGDDFGNGDDADDESDDFDENDVDAWLEEGVERENKNEKFDSTEVTSETELGNGRYMRKEKYILQEKGSNPFEVLPEDWVMVMHNSGMPVYLHKPSRVCTMSRPYFIGQGSVRKHDTPISSIPCLQYRRELEKEANPEEKTSNAEVHTNNVSSLQHINNESSNEPQADKELSVEPDTDTKTMEGSNDFPTPVIAEAVKREDVIAATDLYTYCKSLFQFRSIVVKKFLTWREKRSHLREKYEQEKKKLPKMAVDTKLIVCPMPKNVSNISTKKKKEFLINPVGKSAICILHEYTQHVLRVQPVYNFTEIENYVTPYKATIKIDGIGYGSGVGRCKRQAKAEAAKKALKVFIPKLAEHYKDSDSKAQTSDLAYFEEVAIEDPRVTELCEKAALPKPYQVLTECLRRNYGMGDTSIQVEKSLVTNQKTEFTLTVGKHQATVICRNKLEGKQRAAQAMLQKLHPQLKNWAAILRLYSKSTEVGFQERQEEEAPQQPSTKDVDLLDKLKEAMRKTKYHQGLKNSSNFNTLAPHHLDL